MADELKTDAKQEGSSSSNNGAKKEGSPPLEEVIAENKRKSEEIATLKAEHKKSLDRLSKLEAIEEQRELTAKEEREKANLKDDVAAEVRKLRESKETQPWIKISKDEAIAASTDAVLNNEIERSNDLLEDAATDNKMDVDQFAKELKKFTTPYMNKRPERRTVLAIRDWKAAQAEKGSLAERERKANEIIEAANLRERGGRVPRDESLDKKFENADARDQMRLIADMIPSGDAEK